MADFGSHEELRRQIQALTVENDELRQLVQLLQENNNLKTTLQSQGHESLDASSVESGSFRLPLRLGAAPMTPVGAAAPPFMGSRLASTPIAPHTPPPMQMFTPPPGQMFTPPAGQMFTPPAGQMFTPPAGQMFTPPRGGPIGAPPQAPRGQRMQQLPGAAYMPPPVARLNLQSPPPLRPRSPGDSGMQGAGYISDSSQDSFRSGGSPGILRGRGYCHECTIPFHPHMPQHDSVLSGRMNMSGHSDDSSFG